ncbi:MAG: aminotransferase class V-fold PLP-dependent enzyme [Planctomycetes bacterium]|nr:aminotransferase class V-fold PLP-dependent enzyme [Planctomycetota bacterium]
MGRFWALDPETTFLNHGSFGACPVAVLHFQAHLRARLEREPVRFMARDLERLADEARTALGTFIGAEPDDLAFVPNATTGVSTVLASLDLAPGDELLTTDHAYNACRNAIDRAAARARAGVAVAQVPFPIDSPDTVTLRVMERVTPRTRLALLDHVTSPTGLVFPIAELVGELAKRGVETLVDGAHAPGMLPLDVAAIGAAYYTGNCHKWLCAPKGAAFLHVRRDLQSRVRPLVTSHGANSPRTDRSRFRLEFDWTGTHDPTPYLSIPEAIRHLDSLVPGGWPEILVRNRTLALAARRLLVATRGLPLPAPDSMIGALAAIPLPDSPPGPSPRKAVYQDLLQDDLVDRYGIQVPVMPWPSPPRRLLRVSAQVYNRIDQYERLAAALGELLPRE